MEHKTSIEKIQRDNEGAGSQLDYIQQQIKEVKEERDRLWEELEQVSKVPFFQKESSNLSYQKLEDLTKKIDKEDQEIRNSRH